MMVKTMEMSVPQHYTELSAVKNEGEVNTDNLSPEAVRRLKHFANLVDRFEKAASSGALLPPITVSSSPR